MNEHNSTSMEALNTQFGAQAKHSKMTIRMEIFKLKQDGMIFPP